MRFAEHPASSPYQQGLDKNPANHAPLTPLSFLERTADVFPERTAVVHGDRAPTTPSFARALPRAWPRRSRGAASARRHGGGRCCRTCPAMLEAHFGVPMAGAVLNALNTGSTPDTIAFILEHGEAKVLLTDPEFAPVIEAALATGSAADRW